MQLWRAAIGRQLKVVLLGSAAGVVLSLAAGRILATLLPEITSFDAISVVASATLLIAVAAVAAAIPAFRVVSLNPLDVLRR